MLWNRIRGLWNAYHCILAVVLTVLYWIFLMAISPMIQGGPLAVRWQVLGAVYVVFLICHLFLPRRLAEQLFSDEHEHHAGDSAPGYLNGRIAQRFRDLSDRVALAKNLLGSTSGIPECLPWAHERYWTACAKHHS